MNAYSLQYYIQSSEDNTYSCQGILQTNSMVLQMISETPEGPCPLLAADIAKLS